MWTKLKALLQFVSIWGLNSWQLLMECPTIHLILGFAKLLRFLLELWKLFSQPLMTVGVTSEGGLYEETNKKCNLWRKPQTPKWLGKVRRYEVSDGISRYISQCTTHEAWERKQYLSSASDVALPGSGSHTDKSTQHFSFQMLYNMKLWLQNRSRNYQ